jgi:hypothetical protein
MAWSSGPPWTLTAAGIRECVVTTAPATSPAAVVIQCPSPAMLPAVLVRCSPDGRSCFEVAITGGTGGNVVARRVTFGSVGVALATVAHGLTTGVPFRMEVRVVGNILSVRFNDSTTDLLNYDMGSSLASLGWAGFASSTNGCSITLFQVCALTAVIEERTDVLWASAGGDLVASRDGTSLSPVAQGVFSALDRVIGVEQDQKLYLFDGAVAKVFDPLTFALTAYVPSAGQLPGQSGVPGRCTTRAAEGHLGRVVMENGNDLLFTAVNNPLDCATGSGSPGGAFALAVATNGKLDGTVKALKSTDRLDLLIGTDRSIWRFSGDPALGAVELNKIADVGVTGPLSFVRVDPPDDDSPGFTVAHTTGGLGIVPDGGVFVPVSSLTLAQLVEPADPDLLLISLVRLVQRHGIMIFLTQAQAGLATGSTSLYYAEKIGQYSRGAGGFFPTQLPDSVGPTAAWAFKGNVIMGGRNGYLFTLNDRVLVDDDGAANVPVVSRMPLAPLIDEAIDNDVGLCRTHLLLAATSDPVKLEIYGGQSPEQAYDGPNRRLLLSREVSAVRQDVMTEVRAPALVLEIGNAVAGRKWRLEAAKVEYEPMELTRHDRLPVPAEPPCVTVNSSTDGVVTFPGGPGPGDGSECEDPVLLSEDPRCTTLWRGGSRSKTGGWSIYNATATGGCCCDDADVIRVVQGWSEFKVFNPDGSQSSKERFDIIVPASPTPGWLDFITGFARNTVNVEYGLRLRTYDGADNLLSDNSTQKLQVQGPLGCEWDGFALGGGGGAEYSFDMPLHAEGMHPWAQNCDIPDAVPATGQGTTWTCVSYKPLVITCNRLKFTGVWRNYYGGGAVFNEVTAVIEWEVA